MTFFKLPLGAKRPSACGPKRLWPVAREIPSFHDRRQRCFFFPDEAVVLRQMLSTWNNRLTVV